MRRTGHAARQVGGGAVGVSKRGSRTSTVSLRAVEQGELRVDVAELEVPPADPGLAVPVAERAVGHDRLAGARVDEDGLEGGVLLVPRRSRRGRPR